MLKSEIVREQSPLPIPALGTKRQVLVIEDNKTVRKAVSRRLVSLGYRVTLASSGYEGGILFLTRSFDLAIIDVDAPQMKVWQLSRIFKEHSPTTPVIVANGFTDEKHREEGGKSCVDAIIPKPVKLNDVEWTVWRLLTSGA